jgi:ADP-ribosylglycohydrolase
MTTANKLDLAKTSLLGLSIGDELGARMSDPDSQEESWAFTDNTVMGIGVYNILSRFRYIDQEELAHELANNYIADINRGYSGSTQRILKDIADGSYWMDASSGIYEGNGSPSNKAAARSAPIGAYFYEHSVEVIRQAERAARVTNWNPEGIAGAIAVALAACVCTRYRLNGQSLSANEFYDFIIDNMPASEVKAKIQKAKTLPESSDIATVVSILGNHLTAPDTVPFALWCAANHFNSFPDAIRIGISGSGDGNTIAAIIGSIVVLSAGVDSIPEQWIAQAEKFSYSPFFNKIKP